MVALIGHDFELTLFGAGIIFTAVAFYFVLVIFEIGYEKKATVTIPARKGGLGFNWLLAAVLGACCFYFSVRLRPWSGAPPYFQQDACTPLSFKKIGFKVRLPERGLRGAGLRFRIAADPIMSLRSDSPLSAHRECIHLDAPTFQ
jgi:hypothetical protein